MQIPDDAQVKPYLEAELGSLLIGRFRAEDGNFFAIRTKISGDADAIPYMVILTPSLDNQPGPYLCAPRIPPNVLDLGTGWSVDVSVDRSTPYLNRASGVDAKAILVRSGPGFFIDMREDGYFLDLATGLAEDNLPNRRHVASWSHFSINLPQPDVPGLRPAVFRWPEKEE